MHWLEDMPIKRKLTLAILATCTVVLLLACTALATFELFDFRRVMKRDMMVLADIMGKTTRAALTFQDEETTRGFLQALQTEPHVMGARLFDQAGRPFVDYVRPEMTMEFPSLPGKDGAHFAPDHLAIFCPILLNENRIGTIYLQADLQGMYERLYLFGGISGLVLLGSFLLAIVLSTRLQRPISDPILALAKTARLVAEGGDYTVRAPRQGQNELGTLTDSFNHMLTQIHEQNQALKEGEERVRAVLNCALSAVVVIDAEGKIVDWNARAENMFDWKREEAIGKILA
jgi:methyl-accepting chemotaxis protein